ncbi:uncharacterized protein [Venturia canescens]|uniref:uncharacterized protein n=1 Tax=Venturia canescens TaxID=32260 RepID=UPI001C9BD040|nr:uncharacterized protein LOC122406043 [Venturia canescens]
MQSLNMTEAKAGVGVTLPIDTLEIFTGFDNSLEGNIDQKNALMALYRILTCGETSAKNCIAKTMLATVTKNVEKHYSGTGRKVHGVGKEDFSKTIVFSCIQDVLLEKFGDSKEIEGLKGKIGKWLSGATDRAGGRKER